jgi:AAA family ATP:ADP antiporter
MSIKNGHIRRIKPGEGGITSLMFSYVAGVLAFYYILKPLRSAFFLRDLPASALPNAYLLTALLAAPLVTLVFKLNRRLTVIALITATNLGVVASLLFFRWAVSIQIPYLPYAYFSYVQIVSVLCVAQFWLLAGCIFDARQAKRLYGVLGTGAITGSIAGSLITDLLKNKSMGAMLSICIGICLALTVLAQVIWRHRRPDVSTKESGRNPESSEGAFGMLRTVYDSRLLRLMVLLVFLTMIASQIADWQVDYAAQENFKHLPKPLMEQAIKSFRARFNWITNLVGIVLQLSVTHFVVQRAGIWAAILFLPIGLGATSLGVLVLPSLNAVTIALGCNSVFRYSINRAGLELLFLPLTASVRKKVKLFIDVFVDRVGIAAAAFIILALTTRDLPFGLAGTAAAIIALTGACLFISLKLRGVYVDAFRQQLVRREVDLSEASRYVTDPASLHLLLSALDSPNERQILYSLGLLQTARGRDFSAQLLPLMNHRSSFVREEAVRTLQALPGSHEMDAARMLEDASEGVRNAAIEYLCLQDPGKTRERLAKYLNHANPDIRLAAARCAASQPYTFYPVSMKLIVDLMALDGTWAIQAHEVAALLAARLPAEESVPLLRLFLQDRRRQIAAGAVHAAGQANRLELVGEILPLLSERKLRAATRQALVSMGPRIMADLSAVMADESKDPAVRYEIPWILSRIQDEAAAGVLVENLNVADLRLRYQIVKALSRMHGRNFKLPGNERLVEVHLIAQIMAYYEGLALLQAVKRKTSGEGEGLVARALQERLEIQLEMVFRLLGLGYSQKDIYFAYAALKGQPHETRISAIEFLDSILKKDVKALILPLLEAEAPEQLLARAAHFFGIRVPSRNNALIALLQQPDPWLQACSLYAIGLNRIAELEPFCRQLVQARDSRVPEMVEWTLGRISSQPVEEYLHADKP